MATGGGEVNSDEIKNIKCCFCSKKNRNREAVKYCVECKEYYCLPCTDTHQMFPSMTGHVLLDKADFSLRSVGSVGDLLSVPTQRCSQHHTEVINMYCKDHDEVACPPCIALNHRSCTNILFIPDEVDNLYNKTEVTEIKQNILPIKTTIQEIKSANKNKFEELKEVFDKEVQSVKTIRLELQALLDKLEQKTLEELEKEFNTMESCLTSQINEVDNITEAISTLSVQMKKAEGNKAQEFVSVKFLEKVTAKAKKLEREHHIWTEETVSFIPDQNIKAFLQLQNLGKVTRIKQGIINFKSGLYKVKYQREIDAKLATEVSNCSIGCSCITPDGFLLLADNGNKQLKRLDLWTETINDCINLQAFPRAVCLISKTEVAVALEGNIIQFVSLENKLSATRKLIMNHPCYGLAHNDGKLFICDNAKTLYIDDMNGQELKRISTNTSGKKLFHEAAHITFSAEGDQVFVADGNNGIVILDIQGNHLSTVSYSTLSRTCGVCTDGRNLFVCGLYSSNIVQIGHDYNMLGQLVNVKQPYSLCFDPRNTRLFVTLCGNNKIIVLDLE